MNYHSMQPKVFLVFTLALAHLLCEATNSSDVFISAGIDERIVEVYENQVWIWNQGWIPSSQASNLPHWSYQDGSKAVSIMEISLPDDWEWTSEWTTAEGTWEYGVPTTRGSQIPWLKARLRRRKWWRAMALRGASQRLSDLPFELSRTQAGQNGSVARKVVPRQEVFLSQDYRAEPLSMKPRRFSVARELGWNFKGIGFGFKKPLLASGVVVGLRVPLSRNFDKWDRCELLPSISTFVGGSVRPPILTAAVSCSLPLEFFTAALTFNRALMRQRKDTVRRVGGTFTVVYTPSGGWKHTFAPWVFILPGARAAFQFCRALLLWIVSAFDQIVYRSVQSTAKISLKGRFPTLWRLRRWTGSKTSGLGYSLAYNPYKGRISSSVLLNFEPFFISKKKRKREEELLALEHEIKQQMHRKESRIKHTPAWYEQSPDITSWVEEVEKQMQEESQENPFLVRQEEFTQELSSVDTAVTVKDYYASQNWYLPKEKEISYVDTWFDPKRTCVSSVQHWYTPQQSFVAIAATNSSSFVEQTASEAATFVSLPDEEKHALVEDQSHGTYEVPKHISSTNEEGETLENAEDLRSKHDDFA